MWICFVVLIAVQPKVWAVWVRGRGSPERPKRGHELTAIASGMGLESGRQQHALKTSTVFYNVHTMDRNLTEQIVVEQLETLSSPEVAPYIAAVFYNTIGEPFEISGCPKCVHLQHRESASEALTLQSMFLHCKKSPDDRVIYMHSKGSYHPTEVNTDFRRFIMQGAFSEPCLNMPSKCNLCGARFSPLPHQHVPGNMFTVECEYIQKLIPPAEFEEAMDRIPTNGLPDHMQGKGRFAMEHWVGSHPHVQPCDVYSGNYQCGYAKIPTKGWTPDLRTAPRYEMSAFRRRYPHICASSRALEYEALYPDADPQQGWAHNYYVSAPRNTLTLQHLTELEASLAKYLSGLP